MGVKEVKYVEYIKSRFPQIYISKIEYNLNDGRHCDVVIINDEHVFKFAKHDWSVAFLENEVQIVDFISSYVDIPLPKFERLDKGIAKCNFIKGLPLFRNKLLMLGNRAQEGIAEQIGTFLRQLHSIPIRKIEDNKIAEFSGYLTREEWLSEYEEIQRKVFPYCTSYSKEYINQIFKPMLDDENFLDFQPVLIHGDPAPYHFFLDKGSNRINGVIDFGLAGTGDPAYDVGIILDNLGEAFVKRMSRYYGKISTFIDRARFYAYVNNFRWAKMLSDMITTRDLTHLQFYAKDRDIMPIGSGW